MNVSGIRVRARGGRTVARLAAGLALGAGAGLLVAADVGPAPALAAPAASVPVFSAEVPAGTGTIVPERPRMDPPRRLDGNPDDWRGQPSGFGGTLLYSSGELVYQDHIFDAWGPDNGQNTRRLAVQDPLAQQVPETYRLDPAIQYLPGEFGIPTPGFSIATHYGALDLQDQADLSELRVGSDPQHGLWLLARTTTMTAPSHTALLVLIDTGNHSATSRPVPFNSGITTTRASYALLLSGDRGWSANLQTGAITALASGSVASNPSGYVNAIEAHLPPAAIGGGLPAHFSLAAATGLIDPAGGPRLKDLGVGANLANVAFRTAEPVRDYWDKQQALVLYQRTIDPFFASVDLGALLAGVTQRYQPGPGYHDRIFTSEARISQEQGQEGILQHYGVYLPGGYTPARRWPLQWWLHFRGGNAHIAAALVPRIFQDMGEAQHTIVVTPRGRGEDSWYVGRGMVDFQEVWADVHRLLAVDPNRTYLAGHSMGGWGTYLMSILYPDRFAAGFPASGAVTQGAWTGVDAPHCDELSFQGETPCYTGANGGDPRVELTRPLLDNLRWVPLAIYQGIPDELVPTSGVLLQTQRLAQLGYRYRLYLFPAQEHYGPPIQDQWTEGAQYEHQFVRDPDPPRVTYIRSMPFEHAIGRVNSGGVPLEFHFDSAYWMSGLTPVDPTQGVARFDGRSLARVQAPYGLAPEAGGPATLSQTGPYAMTGQAWRFGGAPAARRNAFEATLSGTAAVTLDGRRMALDASRTVTGTLASDHALRLTLRGPYGPDTRARIDGRVVPRRVTGASVAVTIPAGHHVLVLDRVAGRGGRRGRRRRHRHRVRCASRRHFVIRLPRSRAGDRVVRARVLVDGRLVKVLHGRRLRARIDLRGLPRGAVHVTIVAVTRSGRRLRQRRTYHPCVHGRHHRRRGSRQRHRRGRRRA